MAYLDNHTTAPPSKRAIEAMIPLLREKWASLSAPYREGQRLLPVAEEAYRRIYQLIGATIYDGFVFTSSGAEAINQVVESAYLDLALQEGKNHFLTSQVDEAPVVMAYERLEERGCETAMIPVDEVGMVSVEALGDALTPRTALVALSWANALTGVVHPVEELAELCRERGIWFHLDATHVLGKLPFDLDALAPDSLSFHGEHLHAPRGTGGLWFRSGLRLRPLIAGGAEQDGLRGGSVDLPSLVALGVAAQEALESDPIEMIRLRRRLERGLGKIGEVLFSSCERLPGTVLVAFSGVTSDALLYRINHHGVLTSFGGGAYQHLPIQLEAMGVDPLLAQGAISLTLSRYTTEAEIDFAIEVIASNVKALRSYSKEWTERPRTGASS